MSETSAPTAHKFGGSSLASAERMNRVVGILRSRPESKVVVVSAMGGVTDALIAAIETASRNECWQEQVVALERKHQLAASELLGERAEPLMGKLREEFEALREILRAQARIGAVSTDLLELVSGLGEIWSAQLIHAALRAHSVPSTWLDAREVLVVSPTDLGMAVDWDATHQLLAQALSPNAHPQHVIVSGYVARTASGRVTNLGRNGSDYSGAIFAALFAARELHVWSDVDGVLSADPRVVDEAVEIPQLSYSEACELAYFGASVLHPQTMAPAIERDITIYARNTFDPSHPGTRIAANVEPEPPVKGVTTVRNLAILNLEGAGMIGVPGTAQRAFAALEQADVSVVMISQGSSEHSICAVIRAKDADRAEHAVRRAFQTELTSGLISDVRIDREIAALAAVGDGMAGTPGIASRLFHALGRANVNVRAIAQGSSERNISVALDEALADRALRAVHAGFYLSNQTISIGLIGPGNVGRAFLRQVHEARERLRNQRGLDLRVRAITGSRRMTLFADRMADPDAPLERAADLDAFVAHVHSEHLPHAMIVDCSASDAVASRYAAWLGCGMHVITPNKLLGAGPIERYHAVRAQRGTFAYEATVGAGLPIITTLRDLLGTGDRVLAIDGILSGTLGYLFHRLDGTRPFSTLVREAIELGYTEPEPRDDLSGLDVARKLVILARENGFATELRDVELESLVPPALADVNRETFLARLGELDNSIEQRRQHAADNGAVLRYVASLRPDGAARVGLVEVPREDALATLRSTDNIVQFTTERYRDNPLVIRGPGAGPEVTAMGIFADVLRVTEGLGHESSP
ncbi:MAG: bifunctional aspartate kinase/homoserine dehydrogenase I [Planctomycetota bacterium]